jgi:PIN domain nuclease of toxin-antitoxin system
MKFLIDTQALIWFIEGNSQLKTNMRRIIEDPDSQIVVSIASLWEIGIKISIGKLQLAKSIQELVAQLEIDHIQILSIEPAHIYELLSLDHFHKDPFDRIIIAQAIAESMAVISTDEAFKDYPVVVIG